VQKFDKREENEKKKDIIRKILFIERTNKHLGKKGV
jgi:hypothetical protein